MGRRKGWETLSDKYRRRLERAGISRADYESGAPLHKGRGHKSKEHESEQRRLSSAVYRWIREYWNTYQLDQKFYTLYNGDIKLFRAAVRAELKRVGEANFKTHMAEQRELERLYDRGETEEASEKFVTYQRGTDVVMWMYFYHGAFS